jgi:hypothetical protein
MNLKPIYDNSVLWQMSAHERAAFFHVLENSSNRLAVEIGTFCGGSLQHLLNHFENVISIDINYDHLADSVKKKNLSMIAGDSKDRVPFIINHFNEMNEQVDLILIDANHEYDYVLSDLENVLDYIPQSETIVLIHDSWYPPSRRAICDSNKLRQCPYVHFVDTDFCGGNYMAPGRTMGGMCLIQMKSSPREGELVINQSLDNTYRAMNNLGWV